jgi:hypothetical protein
VTFVLRFVPLGFVVKRTERNTLHTRRLGSLVAVLLMGALVLSGCSSSKELSVEERDRLVKEAAQNYAWLGLSRSEFEAELRALGFGPQVKFEKVDAGEQAEMVRELLGHHGTLLALALSTAELRADGGSTEITEWWLFAALRKGKVTGTIVAAGPPTMPPTMPENTYPYAQKMWHRGDLSKAVWLSVQKDADWVGLTKEELREMLRDSGQPDPLHFAPRPKKLNAWMKKWWGTNFDEILHVRQRSSSFEFWLLLKDGRVCRTAAIPIE